MNGRTLRYLLLTYMLVILSTLQPPLSFAEEETLGKILVVHSYHDEYDWVSSITRGIRRALEGTHIELNIFYMDTKRHTDTAWKETIAQEALKTVEEWQPDVVIASDDNAQLYFVNKIKDRSTPQIVFCGVNATPEEYGYPTQNVTGILERAPLQGALALYKRINPNAKRALIMTDDSETSKNTFAYFKTLSLEIPTIDWVQAATFEEWQAAIIRAQTEFDVIAVYTYHTIKENGQSESMNPREVMKWTRENTTIPIVCMLTFAIDDGALCGVVESGLEQGYEAGLIARSMILEHKTAADFPIKVAHKSSMMLNFDIAKRLGITFPEDIINDADMIVDTSAGENNTP